MVFVMNRKNASPDNELVVSAKNKRSMHRVTPVYKSFSCPSTSGWSFLKLWTLRFRSNSLNGDVAMREIDQRKKKLTLTSTITLEKQNDFLEFLTARVSAISSEEMKRNLR